LRKAGWQVVVGVRNGLEANRRITIEGVEFVGLRPKQLTWAWYSFLLSERPEWWYWRCASHLFGLAVLIAKLAGVRMIFAAAFDTDVNIRRALYDRPRWWPLYAFGLACCSRIFVQNENQLLGLPRALRSKALKVPGITPAADTIIPHRERAQYVAWVAMFRKFKRPDLLIQIARQAPDIRFVVCGGPTTFTAEPGYGEHVAETLRVLPNVDYRGWVSPDEAMRVIEEAALFLSTSDKEGFPNTFLQAWSAGTPVISLRVDPDHVIECHRIGILSHTAERAVVDIADLMRSPEAREAISSRARQYVAVHHSTETVLSAFEAVNPCIVSQPDAAESCDTRLKIGTTRQ
jgi:glycosyltransferase involved in cell wall biosynthesis